MVFRRSCTGDATGAAADAPVRLKAAAPRAGTTIWASDSDTPPARRRRRYAARDDPEPLTRYSSHVEVQIERRTGAERVRAVVQGAVLAERVALVAVRKLPAHQPNVQRRVQIREARRQRPEVGGAVVVDHDAGDPVDPVMVEAPVPDPFRRVVLLQRHQGQVDRRRRRQGARRHDDPLRESPPLERQLQRPVPGEQVLTGVDLQDVDGVLGMERSGSRRQHPPGAPDAQRQQRGGEVAQRRPHRDDGPAVGAPEDVVEQRIEVVAEIADARVFARRDVPRQPQTRRERQRARTVRADEATAGPGSPCAGLFAHRGVRRRRRRHTLHFRKKGGEEGACAVPAITPPPPRIPAVTLPPPSARRAS